MSWRVYSKQRFAWSVESPGGRQWTGAPSQSTALNLARSLAAIDTMLAGIHRPAPSVVPAPAPRRASEYGCYRVPSRAR